MHKQALTNVPIHRHVCTQIVNNTHTIHTHTNTHTHMAIHSITAEIKIINHTVHYTILIA